jgi:hypothetical protein
MRAVLKAIKSGLSERLFCRACKMNNICKGDVEAPQTFLDATFVAYEGNNQHLKVKGRTSGGQPQQEEDDWGRR